MSSSLSRARALVLTAGIACVVACGGSGSGSGSADDPGLIPGFHPPAPIAGEQRIDAPVVRGIPGGGDVTYCTYVPNPWDHEVDVVQSLGFQSKFGHHAILMDVAGSDDAQINVPHLCTDADMNAARFLAGGSDTAQNIVIPDGVAFRIAPGRTLMVQSHWINTSARVVDGQAVFNVATREPSPDRQPAQLFTSYTVNVQIPAHAAAHASTECTIQKDLQFFNFGGHAHEWGTHVHVERERGGVTDTLYDQDWQPAFQSAPPLETFPVDAPLVLKKGDVLRVSCDYQSTVANDVRFPREMCVAFGFYFPATADLQCADGVWGAL